MAHSAAGQQHAAKKQTKKQRIVGRPFPRGVSGNPKGRGRGSKNKRTILLDRLLKSDAAAQDLAGIDAVLFKAVREFAPTLLPTHRHQPFSIRRGRLMLAFLRATTGALCVTARLKNQSTDGGDAR